MKEYKKPLLFNNNLSFSTDEKLGFIPLVAAAFGGGLAVGKAVASTMGGNNISSKSDKLDSII